MIKIGNKEIKIGNNPFIVAEAGINHNGSLENALKMVEVAKEAGADCIKFQTFKAKELITDPELTYTYQSQGKEVTTPMIELFSQYELNKEQWIVIKKKCDDLGITFLSTPQNYSDLQLLLEIGIDAIKIGSDDFTNIPQLRQYSSTGKPLILSCGMADMAEIYQSLNAVGAFDGYPVILLLCVSQYPTPVEDVNLARIKTLISAFPNIPIGFSDHTESFLSSTLATALGACFIEKHFTLDGDLPGPDHWFSEDPESLKTLISHVRDAHKAMGQPILRPSQKEEEMKTLARRSLVVIENINEGETLSDKNIGLRRPGNGIPPIMFEEVLGLKAGKSLKTGDLLKLGDFV